MNFADTNWLEAMFFDLTDADKQSRPDIVRRFLRHHGGPIGLSHLVYLEARNVFSRVSGEAEPKEWRQFQEICSAVTGWSHPSIFSRHEGGRPSIDGHDGDD